MSGKVTLRTRKLGTFNVSARQAALNRWTATNKRWKRKAVSQGSVVTSCSQTPSDLRELFV